MSGLFQGIVQERIEDQDRRVPNQGIRRSGYNSVIMGIISGGIIGVVAALSWGSLHMMQIVVPHILDLLYLPRSSKTVIYGTPSLTTVINATWTAMLQQGLLRNCLLIGLLGGLLVCIGMGGLAVWRHYIMRLLLWRSQTFPRRATQFLDDACARFLLRRVGGGYSFVHRLLLDYLAERVNSRSETYPHSQEHGQTEP